MFTSQIWILWIWDKWYSSFHFLWPQEWTSGVGRCHTQAILEVLGQWQQNNLNRSKMALQLGLIFHSDSIGQWLLQHVLGMGFWRWRHADATKVKTLPKAKCYELLLQLTSFTWPVQASGSFDPPLALPLIYGNPYCNLAKKSTDVWQVLTPYPILLPCNKSPWINIEEWGVLDILVCILGVFVEICCVLVGVIAYVIFVILLTPAPFSVKNLTPRQSMISFPKSAKNTLIWYIYLVNQLPTNQPTSINITDISCRYHCTDTWLCYQIMTPGFMASQLDSLIKKASIQWPSMRRNPSTKRDMNFLKPERKGIRGWL